MANETKAGTIGGTLLAFFAGISSGELLHTVILAGVGATVSFSVSLGWKWLLKKFRR